MECIFCKIVNGEIPSYTIYEDEVVKCFLDVNPNSNGHTLIIPKEHFTELDDIDMDTLDHIMKIAKKIKKILTKNLNCDGLTLVQNNGIAQEVKHYHLHLIPQYNNKQSIIDVKEVYEKLTK